MKNNCFNIEFLTAKVKRCVKHQGIGGKKIILEKVVDIDNIPLRDYNIALVNYFNRRNYNCPSFAYYGHVDGLGYFVGPDEIKRVKMYK